ncbi:MAG TPA: hypothetical protein VM934_14800 [Pyrinomonadaceae bacterium]|nr:hypothetical protein [Pyrinomonadaceae bacterium]
MKNLSSVKATLAVAAMLLVAPGVMAQAGRNGKAAPGRKAKSRMAIVAVAKDNRLEFARDKGSVMRSVQRAIQRVKAQEVLQDVDIRSSEKVDYLAVSLQDRRRNTSTLFIQLEPAGNGSTDYRQPGPHVVTCVDTSACGKNCFVIPATNTTLTSCFCKIPGGETNTRRCTFRINKVYMQSLVAQLNLALLAEGFEEAPGEGRATEGHPKDKTPVSVRPRARNK